MWADIIVMKTVTDVKAQSLQRSDQKKSSVQTMQGAALVGVVGVASSTGE